MKITNKAYIKFKLDSTDVQFAEIRFHSVIFEDHSVDNEITKFPIQSGFNVSNHSIRRNRKVAIKAIVSDTQVFGSAEFHEYSQDSNSKAIFAMLKSLVRDAITCTVVTNLDEYNPVIFTGFKTKQEQGMTDAMEFILTGEEVQLGTSETKVGPSRLVFSPVSDAKKQARLAELLQAGLNVPDSATITETTWDITKSMSVSTTAVNGVATVITYDHVAYDPTTEEHLFECSISPDGTVTDDLTNAIIPGGISSRLENGAKVFGNCLANKAIALGTEIVEDTVTTAVGKLKSNIYGALYEKLGINGNRTMGQRLIALGLDCFIVGATSTAATDNNGFLSIQPEQFDTSFPSKDDVLKGAAKVGDGLTTDTLSKASPTTITKISGSSVGSTNFFGDLL